MAKKSKIGTLHLSDWTKGLLLAVLVPVLFIIEQITVGGNSLSEIDGNQLGGAAIAGGLAYILKNLGTNSDGKILKKEPEKKATDNP